MVGFPGGKRKVVGFRQVGDRGLNSDRGRIWVGCRRADRCFVPQRVDRGRSFASSMASGAGPSVSEERARFVLCAAVAPTGALGPPSCTIVL